VASRAANGDFLELPLGVAVLECTRVQWEIALDTLASICFLDRDFHDAAANNSSEILSNPTNGPKLDIHLYSLAEQQVDVAWRVTAAMTYQ
jgi:hypothetical protein